MNTEDVFTADVLRAWKREHERRVRFGASTPLFDSRSQLNDAVCALLAQNNAVFRTYGPDSPAGQDPLSEVANVWREEVKRTIIPNNRTIVELIDANQQFLTPVERPVLEAFRLHAAALDLNHTSGRWRAGAPRFPEAILTVFRCDTQEEAPDGP